MCRKYSEGDVTWSSIEKDILYKTVIWSTDKNGLPKYTFIDNNVEKSKIEI